MEKTVGSIDLHRRHPDIFLKKDLFLGAALDRIERGRTASPESYFRRKPLCGKNLENDTEKSLRLRHF